MKLAKLFWNLDFTAMKWTLSAAAGDLLLGQPPGTLCASITWILYAVAFGSIKHNFPFPRLWKRSSDADDVFPGPEVSRQWSRHGMGVDWGSEFREEHGKSLGFQSPGQQAQGKVSLRTTGTKFQLGTWMCSRICCIALFLQSPIM